MKKSSLILSAVMTFVITGTVMANDALYVTNSNVTITDGIDIDTKQNFGIVAISGYKADITGAEINVNVNNNTGWGITSMNQAKNGGIVHVGDAKTEKISVGVTGKNDVYGILALRNFGKQGTLCETVLTGKNLEINVTSTEGWAVAVHSQNSTTPDSIGNNTASKVVLNAENIKINTNAKEGYSEGLSAMSQGEIIVNGNLALKADTAILARGDAIVKINEDGKHTTKLDGDMSFNYDKATSGTKVDADVLVNLTGSESYWNGNSKVTWGTGAIPVGLEKVTGIDLRINDGATWNPTYVEEADKGDYGTAVLAQNRVTLDGGNIDLTNAKNQQVKIETLAGDNGTIKIGSEDNSLAVTKDNKANNLTVAATQQYAEKIASNDMSTAVNDLASKVKDETNPNADGDSKTAASRVYIPETTVTGAVTADIDKNGNAANVKEAVNTTNAAVSDLASISLMTWRQENNDMNKRLGELRDSKGEHGAWARMARGESKYGAQNVKNQYNYYQVGYDEKLSVNPNWTVGVALTRTEGNSTFATGTGENKHTGFALYGSYLGDNGSFVDLIAKYARLDNEFNATAGIGNGDYKTNGYSLSAEYGKRFTEDNGFWIEPQVELTYGTVGSVDYLTSKGANVHQDGMDSLVGRLGFSLGKNIKQGNVYVRASYLYDFDGDTKAIYTKEDVARSFEQDLGGGWWEVGVGTNLNLSDATHLYFDVEKTFGGNVATPWQWNAGVRWSF